MKTLLLIRHAKSSWATLGEMDFDRPLNERGKKDAIEMGEHLFKENIVIARFVSSPAKRASKTCKAFIKAYHKKEDEIVFIDKLYHASESAFESVIHGLDEKDDSVAIFSHNPGITAFANSLCTPKTFIEMPTCAVFAVQAAVDSWTLFDSAEKQFLFFKSPKEQ